MNGEINAAAELPGRFIEPFVQRLPGRLGKLVMAIVCYALSEARGAATRLSGRLPRPVVTVIYYHEVPADQRAAFARQMDRLMRWTRPLRADYCQPLPPGTRNSIVAFDDGWLSAVENAVPEMARRNVPFVVFLIADYLGCGLSGSSHRRLASAQELLRLDRRLATLGSHSATHAVMTELGQEEAQRELSESRRKLKQILGAPISLFCFPYGLYNEELVRLARAAGYQRVFTCRPGPALTEPREFVVGRIRVDPTDWPIEFHLKLMGAYRWLPAAAALKQRLRRVSKKSTSGLRDWAKRGHAPAS